MKRSTPPFLKAGFAAGCIWLGAMLAGCTMPNLSSPNLTVDAATPDRIVGQEQFRNGNFGLAEEAFRRAVERDPADVDAWLGLGASRDRLRRFDLADRDYAQVEKLTGRTAALLNNRGYSHMLRGNFNAARKDFAEALILAPGHPDIEANLAAATSGRLP